MTPPGDDEPPAAEADPPPDRPEAQPSDAGGATAGSAGPPADGLRNDRRQIFAWAMYDWANSAYSTTVAAALLPLYFARAVMPEGGVTILGRNLGAESTWAYTIFATTAVIFLITPALGAVADFSAAKRRFLKAFAYGGSLFTILLFFSGSGDVTLTLGLFFLTQIGFVSANVFYDGFLPDISTDETIDRVSARGFALGYIGGGTHFALALLLQLFHARLGLDQAMATRIGIASAGIWWLGFSAFALARLRESGTTETVPEDLAHVPRTVALTRLGYGRVWSTAKKLLGFKQLLLFLIAYMIYVDGLQTIISVATVYATETLRLGETGIMVALLVVQIVAFFGALLFAALAGRIGTRNGILVCVAIYAGVTVAAYFLPEGRILPFIGLAAAIGLVQGGTQSLSRSLYGSMIPEEASAEFYGFYSVFSKFAALWGPLIFATVSASTGSARPAILAIIGFFIVGGTLLALVNVDEARASRDRWSFEGARAQP